MSANNQIGILSQMIIISVCIILSILNIIFSKDVNKNKEKILLCTTTSIMFGTIYNIIIGFINIIILLIKSKDEVKEEELPKLEKIEVKTSEKNNVCNFVCWNIYSIIYIFSYQYYKRLECMDKSNNYIFITNIMFNNTI